MNPSGSAPQETGAGDAHGIIRVELSIPCETSQVATARRFVERCLGPQAHVPVLLTSELVTNSVTHGSNAPGAAITITLTSLVRIEVTDRGGPSVPVLAASRPYADSGHGLELVNAMSEQWGYRTGPDGRLVTWCDVAAALTGDARRGRR
jgi:anti-sigma regulatory factor (Ser/Thr protein kinase)